MEMTTILRSHLCTASFSVRNPLNGVAGGPGSERRELVTCGRRAALCGSAVCSNESTGVLRTEKRDDGADRRRNAFQQRRKFLSVASGTMLLNAFGNGMALAVEDSSDASTPPPGNALIQKLLERSKANKAKNDEARLNDYYKRNFKEYFEFVAGTIREKDKSKLTEAEKGILEWLEKNK